MLLYVFSFFLSGCRRSAPPPPAKGREGRRSRSRPNRQGEAPEKGAFPRSSLFYSSRRMMSMCQARSRKKGRDCKVSKKEAPVQLPRGIFSGRARKKASSAVCGCKGTARNPFFPNFIPTFFEKNISYHKNTLYIKHIIPQKKSPTTSAPHPLSNNTHKISPFTKTFAL